MNVWMIHGDDCIVAVADSLDSAVAHLKSKFKPPYKVSWDELKIDQWGADLTGHFEMVPGWSTRHDYTYGFEEREVVSADPQG